MKIIIDQDCVFTCSIDFSIHIWRHTERRYTGALEYEGSIKFYDLEQMTQFVEMCELCLEKHNTIL